MWLTRLTTEDFGAVFSTGKGETMDTKYFILGAAVAAYGLSCAPAAADGGDLYIKLSEAGYANFFPPMNGRSGRDGRELERVIRNLLG
jgi:hypothetical protein